MTNAHKLEIPDIFYLTGAGMRRDSTGEVTETLRPVSEDDNDSI